MDTRSATRFGALRAAVWSGILAALAVLGLLLAFYQVVLDVVDQAALRRQAMALHADTTWRCQEAQETPGHAASQHCLAKLENLSPGRLAVPDAVVLLAAGR